MRLLCLSYVLGVVCLAACGSSIGVGVGLSVATDDSVDDAALVTIKTLIITTSMGETGTYMEPIATTFTRHERFVYRELPSTKMLAFAIQAVDADGTTIATGATATFSVNQSGPTYQGMVLSAPTTQPIDMAGDMNMEEPLPDLAGVDLNIPVMPDMSTLPDLSHGNAPSTPGTITMVSQQANAITITWGASSPGGSPIDHYKIYRNGAAYATAASTATGYTDTNAISATIAAGTGPATTYGYWVSAVDTASQEGPMQRRMIAQIYQNGTDNFSTTNSYSATVMNVSSAGIGGDTTVLSTDAQSGGALVMFVNGATSPASDFEVGAFDHLQFSIKPIATTSFSWALYHNSITSTNCESTYNLCGGGGVFTPQSYGPALVADTWGTYSVPLTVMGFGTATFTGMISGTNLTVQSLTAGGASLNAGDWLMGNGIPAGTYISLAAAGGAVGGGYHIRNVNGTSVSAASGTTIKAVRTNFDNFQLQNVGSAERTWYMDDIMFTAN
jgi:hypothetical protein